MQEKKINKQKKKNWKMGKKTIKNKKKKEEKK